MIDLIRVDYEKPHYVARCNGCEVTGSSPDEAIGGMVRELWLAGSPLTIDLDLRHQDQGG